MAALEKWTPFSELDVIERRMRRMFEDLGFVPAITPAADIYETDEEYVVELEVPGFDQKELLVEVFDHTLSVRGDRSEQVEKDEKTLRLRERLETTFERRFRLPSETDSKQLKADYEKGVLSVHVPKGEALKPRKIEIARK